jgi:multicomponent Na+:H+ antiporter subunit G
MLHVVGFILIFIGFAGILSGIIGIIRFPDFYTKLHGASVIESASVPLTLLGLSFLQTSMTSSLKLIFIILLIFLLNPLSSHMLARCGSELWGDKHDE